MYDQLAKSKAKDELHEIKKIINQVLESMIYQQVLDQVCERDVLNSEIKQIMHENNIK